MNRFYLASCWAAALLFAILFAQVMFRPDAFVQGFGLEPSLATRILARRASMFMLGIAIACVAVRSLPASPWRTHFSLAMGAMFLGLAGASFFEVARKTVDGSVLYAGVVESILGIAFGIHWIHGLVAPRAGTHRTGEI